MKITKKQLKRIIREERAKLIREAKRRTRNVMQAGEKIWFALSTLVDQAMDQSDPGTWRELADDLRGLADDVEDSIPEDA